MISTCVDALRDGAEAFGRREPSTASAGNALQRSLRRSGSGWHSTGFKLEAIQPCESRKRVCMRRVAPRLRARELWVHQAERGREAFDGAVQDHPGAVGDGVACRRQQQH
eukprot:6187394-Pleurochrysis_carterae.AAC.3